MACIALAAAEIRFMAACPHLCRYGVIRDSCAVYYVRRHKIAIQASVFHQLGYQNMIWYSVIPSLTKSTGMLFPSRTTEYCRIQVALKPKAPPFLRTVCFSLAPSSMVKW